MAELDENGRKVLHEMQELAELLGSGHWPGIAEWNASVLRTIPMYQDGRWKHV